MSNDTDVFIQEVDESLRQDRTLVLLRRLAPWLLGAFAVVLAGIGGWQWWRAHVAAEGRAAAVEYAAAQELARAGNFDAAKAAFEQIAADGPRTYRVMAQMERAAVLQAQGDLQGAVAAFDQAAAGARDPIMKQTAQLRAAYLAADTQDFAAVQARLAPLIDAHDQISFLAQELLAVEAWEAGQPDLARDTLESLNLAFGAPESVRQRAQLALAVLGPAPTPAPDAGEPETSAPRQAPRQGDEK